MLGFGTLTYFAIKGLVTLVLTTAAVYAISVAIAVALLALINAYYAMKERLQHSHAYKVFRILIKRLQDKIEQIVVVIGPDGHPMQEVQSETFSAEAMKGTAIEGAFKEAERKSSRVGGNLAIKWTPTQEEENDIKIKAGR